MKALTKIDTPINQRLTISIKETQEAVGVSRNTILKMLKESGASVKYGRRHLVKVKEFNDYLESLRAGS